MKLNMPENITLRPEFWPGFGKPEAAITGIVLTASIFLGVIYAKMQNTSVATVQVVFFTMIISFTTVLFVTKFVYNQSMLDYIIMLIRYNSEQQTYHFKIKEVIVSYVQEEDQ